MQFVLLIPQKDRRFLLCCAANASSPGVFSVTKRLPDDQPLVYEALKRKPLTRVALRTLQESASGTI